MAEQAGGKAQIDFLCVEDGCGGVVKFDLMSLAQDDFQVLCLRKIHCRKNEVEDFGKLECCRFKPQCAFYSWKDSNSRHNKHLQKVSSAQRQLLHKLWQGQRG